MAAYFLDVVEKIITYVYLVARKLHLTWVPLIQGKLWTVKQIIVNNFALSYSQEILILNIQLIAC